VELRRGSQHLLATALGAALVESAVTWLRSGRLGGNVVVRCDRGHLFTTLWIPAVSVKSLRLIAWRFQYCPVGRHWTLVRPVNEDDLSRRQRQAAQQRHDIWLP